MDTKSLLIGISSFIAGALLVSIAATTFDKPANIPSPAVSAVENLKTKTGDEFDEAFIAEMIVHHEGAVEMAKLANQQAKHEEIKKLSEEIIVAQDREIIQMKNWQKQWGYDTEPAGHTSH